MRIAPAVLLGTFLLPAAASAATAPLGTQVRNPYDGIFTSAPVAPPLALFHVGEPRFVPSDQTPAPAVAAFEYSDAYRTRLKIHKISSFATLPLFATELILGQSLYENGGSGKKDAHVAVGVAIGTLFAVNTVTGVWNLIETREDPHGRTKRIVHSILMLAADAGFTATAALAPDSENADFSDRRGTHRAVAITSIGIGTAGYLLMLFTR